MTDNIFSTNCQVKEKQEHQVTAAALSKLIFLHISNVHY